VLSVRYSPAYGPVPHRWALFVRPSATNRLPSPSPTRGQVLAFSATYTPGLLADLEPLVRRPQRVLLCEDTVSLAGIRQFYRLVAPPPADPAAAPQQGASQQQQGAPHEGEAEQGSATEASEAEQRRLLALKVEALLELLAGASFHQVWGSPTAGTRALTPPPSPLATALRVLVAHCACGAGHWRATVHPAPRSTRAGDQPLALPTAPVAPHPRQAVVFCNRKPAAEWLARRLSAGGYPAAYLSSDLPQAERMAAMDALRRFRLRVVVATDVLARGVDLDRVNLVALLDAPPDAATYVHRVGRTGRFGTRGVAVSLVAAGELQRLRGYVAEGRAGATAGRAARSGGRARRPFFAWVALGCAWLRLCCSFAYIATACPGERLWGHAGCQATA
jgi:superfamily II DNA/RNA helicase